MSFATTSICKLTVLENQTGGMGTDLPRIDPASHTLIASFVLPEVATKSDLRHFVWTAVHYRVRIENNKANNAST
jgi:hypothetical protein